METFNIRQWRGNGGMGNPKNRSITSKGRIVAIVANTQPAKGDVYLKPSGKRGIYNVLVAQNDFARKYYPILRIIDGSESETRAKWAGYSQSSHGENHD